MTTEIDFANYFDGKTDARFNINCKLKVILINFQWTEIWLILKLEFNWWSVAWLIRSFSKAELLVGVLEVFFKIKFVEKWRKMTDLVFDDKFTVSSDMLNYAGKIDSPIKDFYKDKVVFLTGGTGFIGKLMIEKMLRWVFPFHKNNFHQTKFNFLPQNPRKIHLHSGTTKKGEKSQRPSSRTILRARKCNTFWSWAR